MNLSPQPQACEYTVAMGAPDKPHAVCIPLPFHSHINAMLSFAKLLHHKGFHITYVNTEFNHDRLFSKYNGSNDSDVLHLPDFRFETIPDGLPPFDSDTTGRDTLSLLDSIMKKFLGPFRELVAKINESDSDSSSVNPPVSCIVSDGFMGFAVDAGEQLGIPVAMFYTVSACSFMGFKQFGELIEKGIIPFKDEGYLTNGCLETIIDWIPGMKDIRLRDLPSHIRTTDLNDIILRFAMEGPERSTEASTVVIHTFNALEQEIITVLSSIIPRIYAIGPLQLFLNKIPEHPLASISYCVWKEESECLQWLNSKPNRSVLYVSFGSLTILTREQLTEIAWGLANSKQPFLWIIRPNLVVGESAILPIEFIEETKDRSLITSWCPQQKVLNHPSIGGFLTHNGWNSTIESLCAGVPLICWPLFADQPTNCYYCCNEWEIGVEIGDGISNDVKRDELEKVVREVLDGERGERMRKKAMEWKRLAEEATGSNGSSSINLDNLINRVLVPKG